MEARGDAPGIPTSRSAGPLSVAAVVVVVAAIAGAWWVHERQETAIGMAQVKFRDESALRSQAQAEEVTRTFTAIYDGIRTIARLPGVRGIGAGGVGFDGNARGAAQEIYNTLASSVAVSEVYIVPLELDPDGAWGPGRPVEPIAAFDELIVGRTGASGGEGAGEAGGEPSSENAAAEIEEVEIFEYRLMRRQLDWMVENCPRQEQAAGLRYPSVCGPEVITCDNTRLDPGHVDNRRRSGLVYSVPFFDAQGALKGCVSAVILSDALRDQLHTGDFALRNRETGYTVHSHEFGVARLFPAEVMAVAAADDLVYSEVVPLGVLDGMGSWSLWCGRLNAEFDRCPEVEAARATAYAAYMGISCIAGVLLLMIRGGQRTLVDARRTSMELARRVEAQTAELRRALEIADAASRAKSDFLANMSHEIRTPMTSIMGYADLMLDPSLSATDRADHVQTIRRQSEHLLTIVNDILDISKIEAGAMTVERIPASPVQVVEDVLSLMRVPAQRKGVVLEAEYRWPLPGMITTDPVRMRQVLINLVGNAVKFTPQGRVVVRVAFDPAGLLRMSVIDTGIGMTPQQVETLFTPFMQADATMTRRFGGTGLGLAISKRLAGLLGGELVVQSRPAEGSTFTFTIPTGPVEASQMRDSAAPRERPAGAAQAEAAAGVRGGLRVLLAEDSIDNQRLISHHLRRAGHSVELVNNGKDAVEAALRADGSLAPFDVLLMDMQMPEMDGYSAASLLRQRGYRGPVIALTAHALAEDRQRCMQAGCDDHLVKPINPGTLLEACARWGEPLRRAG